MLFTEAKLRKEGITDSEQIREYQLRYNRLPNLQLLESVQNTEKNGKHLADWLNHTLTDPSDRAIYGQQHVFPAQASLEFSDFVPFFEARRKLIEERLGQVLGVPSMAQIQEKARELLEKLKNMDLDSQNQTINP